MITPIWEVNKYGWLRESQFHFRWETEKGLDMNNEWPITSDYDSHRPLLYYAATLPVARHIVELGVGNGSTPMLRSLKNKSVWSFETDAEWAARFEDATLIKDYNEIGYLPIDLLFVDSKPGEQRKELIHKYKKIALIIVVHDTEPSAEYVYGMGEVLSAFEHRYDFKPEGMPHTTAVSNFIDVSLWEI